MKYVVGLLIFAFISLTFCTPHQEKPKEQWKEVVCPNCKGYGKVKASVIHRIALGLLTLGCGAMCETTECDMCHGTGVVEQRVIDNLK